MKARAHEDENELKPSDIHCTPTRVASSRWISIKCDSQHSTRKLPIYKKKKIIRAVIQKECFPAIVAFSLSESRKGNNNDLCQLQAGRDREGGALTLVMQQEFTGHASHDNETAVA